ncbi:MAG: LCP family protein, partial [Bacillota bacterium]|nr:LCP family protein [Bacillota bacterium]
MNNINDFDPNEDNIDEILEETHRQKDEEESQPKSDNVEEFNKNESFAENGVSNADSDSSNKKSNLDDDFDGYVYKNFVKRNYKKKMGKLKKFFIIFSSTILGLLLIAGITMFILVSSGKNSLLKDNVVSEKITTPTNAVVNGDDITYNGHTYRRNNNITTILFMGVDKRSLSDFSGIVGEGGQADCDFFVAVDTNTGKTTVFSISRDTMVDNNVYDTNGNFLRTKNEQIGLAYSRGDGKQGSCLNMATSVSRLFYGMPVNSYASLDLDGISVLNDEIGGVTVTVLGSEKTLPKAEFKSGETITLHGSAAEDYVRSRSIYMVDANNYRMQRQEQYLTNYVQKVLSESKHNLSLPINIYNK